MPDLEVETAAAPSVPGTAAGSWEDSEAASD